LLLVLSLSGSFAFAVSGGLAGVRQRLDPFGVVVLAAVVGLAGGVIRDVLIGIRPIAFRDWEYLAVVGAAGLLTSFCHPRLEGLRQPIDVLDAGGLALFSVTGAVAALEHGIGAPEAVVLGAISGIGGGIVRDLLIGKIPVVLRRGFYAIPALIGAGIVVVAYEFGATGIGFPILAAATCFGLRLVGVLLDLNLPSAQELPGRLGAGLNGRRRR
jgi:uncharacterized membrane protein YeiH